MMKECPQSCGVCDGIKCADNNSTQCQIWAEAGECLNNPLAVMKECPESCGVREPRHPRPSPAGRGTSGAPRRRPPRRATHRASAPRRAAPGERARNGQGARQRREGHEPQATASEEGAPTTPTEAWSSTTSTAQQRSARPKAAESATEH